MRKHIATTMMTILLLLLTACASAITPPADEIASQMQAALETPMHGIMEMTNLMPGGREETSVMEMWQNSSEQIRQVTLEGPEGAVGTLHLRNGNEMWFYNPNDNTYSHQELSGMPSSEETGGQMTQMVEQMLESMDITYLGSGEVAERKVHELKFSPKEGEEGEESTFFMPGETTISVESETWFPLKMEIESEEFGMKMEFREIEFNPDFSPDTFTFVPPEGAEEREINMPEELTLEEVREKAPFTLLEPTSLPEGFEFESAQLFEMADDQEMGGTSVILNYRNGGKQLMISQFYSPEGHAEMLEMAGAMEAEKVTVRGQEGYLMETGMGMRGLMWVEDDLQLSLFGSLSEEEMLTVAESME
jgi:outer membrane lipoprotein-sorting protein